MANCFTGLSVWLTGTGLIISGSVWNRFDSFGIGWNRFDFFDRFHSFGIGFWDRFGTFWDRFETGLIVLESVGGWAADGFSTGCRFEPNLWAEVREWCNPSRACDQASVCVQSASVGVVACRLPCVYNYRVTRPSFQLEIIIFFFTLRNLKTGFRKILNLDFSFQFWWPFYFCKLL